MLRRLHEVNSGSKIPIQFMHDPLWSVLRLLLRSQFNIQNADQIIAKRMASINTTAV